MNLLRHNYAYAILTNFIGICLERKFILIYNVFFLWFDIQSVWYSSYFNLFLRAHRFNNTHKFSKISCRFLFYDLLLKLLNVSFSSFSMLLSNFVYDSCSHRILWFTGDKNSYNITWYKNDLIIKCQNVTFMEIVHFIHRFDELCA